MIRYAVRTTAGKTFEAADDESILDAALRAGVVLAYSCQTGRCSTCKGRVLRGSTVALRDELGLSQQESDQGWILTCVRATASDIELDVEDMGGANLFPARVLPARIDSLEHLSQDFMKVMLRLPPGSNFQYHAGQHLDVAGPGGMRRSYSIANAPGAGQRVELHVRRVVGGEMSGYWFEKAAKNDLLRIKGPLGTFFLRDIDDLDLVFLATGTGIAPVKAMLERLTQEGHGFRPKSVTVLWGGRTLNDIYWDPRQVGGDLRYVPVLSRPLDGWTGASGYVQQVLLKRMPDMSRMAVYACGSDAMIHGARTLLANSGLPEHRFRSDAFVSSSTA